MNNSDVDEAKAVRGEYCRKQFSLCFCNVGYPYERQCVRCRDTRPAGDHSDWCWYGGFCWDSDGERSANFGKENPK